jgi:hypothetical protein
LGGVFVVAPLTTALMTSVPKQNSGVGSAVNNAISRVGPQLAGSLIFVAIAASFYSGLASRVPGLDTASSKLRAQVTPFNRPDPGTSAAMVRVARDASTHSFHVAMVLSAALLFAGAAVSAVGIRDPGGPPWVRHPRAARRPPHPHFRGTHEKEALLKAGPARSKPPPWVRKE